MCSPVLAKNLVFLDALQVDYPIIIDGNPVNFDLPTVSINDRTYLPLRALCEKLNINIRWNNSSREVELSTKTITPDDETIEVGITGIDGWMAFDKIDLEISKNTAITLADEIYTHIFGDEYINNTNVYVDSTSNSDCYIVFRYGDSSYDSQYEIYIRKSDGKIVKVELTE